MEVAEPVSYNSIQACLVEIQGDEDSLLLEKVEISYETGTQVEIIV